MADSRRFVIVGASLAGAKAAETLRKEGFEGAVTLIGSESHRPYERPPLSKEYLQGRSPRDKVFVHEENFYGDNDIELLSSTTVTTLDADKGEVILDSGATLAFDACLLATGAEPRRLGVPGSDLAGIHYLRTIDDSERLREAIQSASSVAVIGAGWIGCEVAASARQLGAEVSIVESFSVPLERVLGQELGRFYAGVHADHGVQLHMGAGVSELRGGSSVEEVVLDNGQRIPADLVVAGIGVSPRTALASDAGLTVESGVVTDSYLATSKSGIFAAGDVADAWHPLFNRRVRLEHWSSALNQGPTAALNMLGKATPYDRVRYFFSDQYEVGMEYSGLGQGSDQVVFRGDPGSREFIAFWVRDSIVVAGVNVNVWDVNPQIADLVAARLIVDQDQLADPDVDLSVLAAGKQA
ncbi:MAG: NAD(P)/FAD-dependent oxidoreductase [Acidimicrobiales bacterium]